MLRRRGSLLAALLLALVATVGSPFEASAEGRILVAEESDDAFFIEETASIVRRYLADFGFPDPVLKPVDEQRTYWVSNKTQLAGASVLFKVNGRDRWASFENAVALAYPGCSRADAPYDQIVEDELGVLFRGRRFCDADKRYLDYVAIARGTRGAVFIHSVPPAETTLADRIMGNIWLVLTK